MTTLHDQLADLADAAPPGGPVTGLWQQGARRQRRRRAARLGAAAAAVMVVATLAAVLRPVVAEEPEPVQAPFGELHLPRAVHAPDPWAHSTARPGRLAVVGLATEYDPAGIRGHVERLSAFGVSAVDGSAVFLDLPYRSEDEGLGPGAPVLSPDGTKVAWVRYAPGPEATVAGFAVLDTMTGRTRKLEDPDNSVIKGMDLSEPTFSGDSRFLETTYSLTGSDAPREHALVLWDVTTGERTVAEPAGSRWLPTMGSGPSGTVWSRGNRVLTFDPATGRTAVHVAAVPSDFGIMQASYGPGGRAFAAIVTGNEDSDQWRLYAGPTPEDVREVRPGPGAVELIGWRDPQHLVLRSYDDDRFLELDPNTGLTTDLGVTVDRDLLDLPSYAADLWANPLVDGVRPADARDPRTPWWFAGTGLGVLAAAAFVTWWRRRV